MDGENIQSSWFVASAVVPSQSQLAPSMKTEKLFTKNAMVRKLLNQRDGLPIFPPNKGNGGNGHQDAPHTKVLEIGNRKGHECAISAHSL
jgi:hypothetical protein